MVKTILIGLSIISILFELDVFLNSGTLGWPKTINVSPLPYVMSWLGISLLTWLGVVIAGLYIGYTTKTAGWLYAGVTGVVWVVLYYALQAIGIQLRQSWSNAAGFDKSFTLELLMIVMIVCCFLVGLVSMVSGYVGSLIKRNKLLG